MLVEDVKVRRQRHQHRVDLSAHPAAPVLGHDGVQSGAASGRAVGTLCTLGIFQRLGEGHHRVRNASDGRVLHVDGQIGHVRVLHRAGGEVASLLVQVLVPQLRSRRKK